MKRFLCVLLAIFLLLGLVAPVAVAEPHVDPLSASVPTLEVDIIVYQPGYFIIHPVPNVTIIVFANGIEFDRFAFPDMYGSYFITDVAVPTTFTFRAEAPGFVFVPSPHSSLEWDGRTSTLKFISLRMHPAGHLPFRDVAAGAWYLDSVRFVYENDIMTGINSTTFAPYQIFSREMAAAMVFRIHHGRPADDTDSTNNPFTDVPAGHWSAPYVTWAYQHALVLGTSATTFAPGAPVLRQDFALVLWRYAFVFDLNIEASSGPFDSFPDAYQTDDWARHGLNWAVYHELVRGIDGNLDPRGRTNRAQAATLLERFVTTFVD